MEVLSLLGIWKGMREERYWDKKPRLVSWIKACVDDIYWYYSFDSFKEYVDANGIEFFEDGSVLNIQ